MLGPRVCTQITKVEATNLCASDWHLLTALVHVCSKEHGCLGHASTVLCGLS